MIVVGGSRWHYVALLATTVCLITVISIVPFPWNKANIRTQPCFQPLPCPYTKNNHTTDIDKYLSDLTHDDKFVPVPLPTVQCDHYFIDLGANNGVSTLDFLFPEKDSRHNIARHVKQQGWSEQKFCVIGFEANDKFTNELRNLQNDLRSTGHHVTFITNTAVANADSDAVQIIIDDDPGAVGSSILLSKKMYLDWEIREYKRADKHHIGSTRSIDFAKFIYETMGGDNTVVVKMDIEGAEYSLLRHLLTSGVFCHRVADGTPLITYLLLEFHGHLIDMVAELPLLYSDEWSYITKGMDGPSKFRFLNNMLVWMIKECGVQVLFGTD